MKLRLLLALLLLGSAPLRAAEPVHLIPKFEAALRDVRGPMAFVAGKLGGLDYTVKDGQAHPETLKAIREFFEPLQNHGFEAFDSILMVHSAKARQEGDRAIEGYLYAVEKGLSRGEHIQKAGDILLDRRRLLPQGYEEALVDLVSDRAEKVADFEKRRLRVLKDAYAIADALDPAKSGPAGAEPQAERDQWRMRKLGAEVARFVITDGLTAAARNEALQDSVDELSELVEASFDDEAEDAGPKTHEQLYAKASFTLNAYIDTLSADEGLDDYGKEQLKKAVDLLKRLEKNR